MKYETAATTAFAAYMAVMVSCGVAGEKLHSPSLLAVASSMGSVFLVAMGAFIFLIAAFAFGAICVATFRLLASYANELGDAFVEFVKKLSV